MKCKCHPNKDFNICARECPVMCNEPVRTSCSQECAFGCDCPPGMVRDPRRKNRCVKAVKCSLTCPAHSKFEFCASTCAPKCGRRERSICTTRCQRGGCVCDSGYAEVEHNGEALCVPQGECSRYLKITVPLRPGEHGNIGGGLSSGRVTGAITGARSSECGCLEEPVRGRHQKDRFCRPHLTPLSERRKVRSCVCRPGLVRNSWGDCITKKECLHCKCFRDKDFNVCKRKCPLFCNEPIRASCSQKCVLGCDCAPGTLREPRTKKKCVKTTKCTPRCPPHSRFEVCISTCAPKCGKKQPKFCVTRCQRGGCVCFEGYAEAERDGELVCVPNEQCDRYVQPAVPATPAGYGYNGTVTSSVGNVSGPGSTSRYPSGTFHGTNMEGVSSTYTNQYGEVGGGWPWGVPSSEESMESFENTATKPSDVPIYGTGSGLGSEVTASPGTPANAAVGIGKETNVGEGNVTVNAPVVAKPELPTSETNKHGSVVNTPSNGASAFAAHSARCGCLEKPPKYKTCKDPLCHPRITPDEVKNRHYPCVCRLGAYRNPWGECITLDECKSCGRFLHMSYNLCASECPMTCGEPVPNCSSRLGGFRNPWGHCITLEECRKCSTHPHKSYNLCASECPMTCDQPIPNCSSRCVVGCDCAPGYVRDKVNPEKCVKADCCPPRCPANSKFQLCISNCRRTCDRQQPRKCFTSCTRGGCVCNKGFSELVVAGVTTCVPDFQCPKTQQRRDI
ncbi:hypothetical protein HPB50_007539 [Hyalomma asiaticum]|uniref:Uncharacterized protein n=1 Tax=Hyalomma asiaticum TaxID=266040 RepID=A0ACB7RPL6_HYAAI|nr:hypothetical protein HPB50_007539 [Hyalomma asiaticum]